MHERISRHRRILRRNHGRLIRYFRGHDRFVVRYKANGVIQPAIVRIQLRLFFQRRHSVERLSVFPIPPYAGMTYCLRYDCFCSRHSVPYRNVYGLVQIICDAVGFVADSLVVFGCGHELQSRRSRNIEIYGKQFPPPRIQRPFTRYRRGEIPSLIAFGIGIPAVESITVPFRSPRYRVLIQSQVILNGYRRKNVVRAVVHQKPDVIIPCPEVRNERHVRKDLIRQFRIPIPLEFPAGDFHAFDLSDELLDNFGVFGI